MLSVHISAGANMYNWLKYFKNTALYKDTYGFYIIMTDINPEYGLF